MRTTVAGLLLALVPALAACGGDEPDAAPTAERTAANGDTYNDADVSFATGMIPVHADALVMVDMTQGRDLSPDLARLTEALRDAQAPEIEQMADWLTAWGEQVPETSRDHVNSHGGGGADGDLSELEDADASAFEDLWLEMMIEHHEGAIEMAQEEQVEGLFGDALGLAQALEARQAEEIEQMEAMLDD